LRYQALAPLDTAFTKTIRSPDQGKAETEKNIGSFDTLDV
jgi:hypothetical protein